MKDKSGFFLGGAAIRAPPASHACRHRAPQFHDNSVHTSTHLHALETTPHLLHLEANGCPHFVHLLFEVVVVGEHGGELPSLAQPRPQETRDLLDQTVRGQECIILLG